MPKKRVGYVLRHAAPNYVANLAEHHRQPAIASINAILTTVEVFNDELLASAEDRTLTPAGQAARAAKAASAALTALTTVEGITQKLTDRATALETGLRAKAAFTAPKDAGERAAHESRLREIRDELRGLSDADRLIVYRSTTDRLTLEAIESAPPTLNDSRRRFEPFVDPAVVAEVVMTRGEAADPAGARTLRELRDLAEVYRLAVNGVRREILEAVPTAGAIAS